MTLVEAIYRGLNWRLGLRGLEFVGFDLVEVQPQYDHGEVTSLAAGTLLHEFLTLVALFRRDGQDATRRPSWKTEES